MPVGTGAHVVHARTYFHICLFDFYNNKLKIHCKYYDAAIQDERAPV
jgi:hypothetical protein